MKKIRCFLAAIALLATLGGSLFLQGMSSASLANAASSHHVSSVAFKIGPSCGGVMDC